MFSKGASQSVTVVAATIFDHPKCVDGQALFTFFTLRTTRQNLKGGFELSTVFLVFEIDAFLLASLTCPFCRRSSTCRVQLRAVRARATLVLLRTDMALAQVQVRFSLHFLNRLAHLCLVPRLVAVR